MWQEAETAWGHQSSSRLGSRDNSVEVKLVSHRRGAFAARAPAAGSVEVVGGTELMRRLKGKDGSGRACDAQNRSLPRRMFSACRGCNQAVQGGVPLRYGLLRFRAASFRACDAEADQFAARRYLLVVSVRVVRPLVPGEMTICR